MFAAVCKRYLSLAKVQVKLSLLYSFGLAVLLIVITPLIFGIKYLDAVQSSFVLERFVSLTGIIFLVPLFYPEQDKDIAEVVGAKYTPQTGIILIRLFISMMCTAVIIICFTLLMHFCDCEFDVIRFFVGTFATAFILGSLGFMIYGVTNNIIVGYLSSLSYYLINFMSGRKLGNFYVFSLSRNSFTEKYWILGAGCVLILMVLVIRYIYQKRR